jgi:acetyl esterase/lipase
MSKTRHLVDPEILLMLEMPDRALTHETLETLRNDPLFSAAGLPPPFPVSEAFATNERGTDVRLLMINPPSEQTGRAAILHIHGGGMVVGVPDTATVTKCLPGAGARCGSGLGRLPFRPRNTDSRPPGG